ncbi:beta-N-acetylhexosaminidase [Pseudothermotoga elfii]|uniref:beta-N-acetylhexosaminidase n=1 Tax=Pseudothermotoga elfii TaxID=38322 RepID=UPI0003FB2B96|nr:family 20 glycosylhydrolase [Pseudothermotoga elfii]
MLPRPKKITILNDIFEIPVEGKIFTLPESFKLAAFLKDELTRYGKRFLLTGFNDKSTTIKIILNPNMVSHSQGYKIKITPNGIVLMAKTTQGIFYSLQSLIQLMREYECRIPTMIIEDEPDFENRGFMLDISRDRIPNMDTLKKIVDILAELKYNQFQLYTEHTFAYSKHELVWRDYTPLTSEEIQELDNYCRERFIELVPNQNSFGHLGKWLKHDQYKYLAECPDGFITPWGEKYGPFSLSPAVPETLNFLSELFDELLPNFTSTKVNIGADETYDLGLGKSKELCEKYGKGRVYLDFLLKIHQILNRHGKTVMFWGDIIKNYPELVAQLPDNTIALLWGYEGDHPYDEECKLFATKGVAFYVCPGTSTWDSFTGRSDNALANIKNALVNGKKYNSIGFLLTDWGDNGHHQHLPFSMISLGYAASLGWNLSENLMDDELLKKINTHVFKTRLSIAESVYNLGTIYKRIKLKLHNTSPYFISLVFPHRISKYLNEIDDEDIKNTEDAIEIVNTTVHNLSEFMAETKSESEKLTILQIINNAEMLALGMESLILIKQNGNISLIPEERKTYLKQKLEQITEQYRTLWPILNREGGLNYSVEKLSQISKYL